jgi:hypothetical protein
MRQKKLCLDRIIEEIFGEVSKRKGTQLQRMSPQTFRTIINGEQSKAEFAKIMTAACVRRGYLENFIPASLPLRRLVIIRM